MKITFFSSDPGNHRFIWPIIERLHPKYECELLNNFQETDADVYWFDFCDNNLIVASRDFQENLKSKKVIARLHSVEYYMGFHRQIEWGCVNDLIFVSDHMRENVRRDFQFRPPSLLRIHTVHNAVDLSKFRFSEHLVGGAKFVEPWNFGYVGNIVPQKGILTFAHYFASVKEMEPKAKWYLAGLNRMHGREGEYWEHFKATVPDVYEEEETGNVDEWLEDRNIHVLVQPSCSESFSIVVAEAMAKGIKVAVNNYIGADELWPKDLVYSNFKEFCGILEAKYESRRYREWVEKRYSLDDQIKKLEGIIENGKV